MKKFQLPIACFLLTLCMVFARFIPVPTARAQVTPASFWFGPWTAYVPSTTNLSSVTPTGYGIQNGKTAFMSFWVTGTSNGSAPTISVPYTMIDLHQTFACNINNGVTFIAGIGVEASQTALALSLYTGAAPSNGTTYIFVCNGVYQTQ